MSRDRKRTNLILSTFFLVDKSTASSFKVILTYIIVNYFDSLHILHL